MADVNPFHNLGDNMTTFTTEDKLHAGEYPLSEEQIKEIMSEFYSYNPRLLEFARAIERAHGITE